LIVFRVVTLNLTCPVLVGAEDGAPEEWGAVARQQLAVPAHLVFDDLRQAPDLHRPGGARRARALLRLKLERSDSKNESTISRGALARRERKNAMRWNTPV
jgi:hypothetical protein